MATNIELRSKLLTVTNTIGLELIMTVKSFVIQNPGDFTIKLFIVVSFGFS
jgi:hypothetical protein